MAGSRLFNPSGGLNIRDPQDNGSKDGMIVNPPRYMQFGGFKKGANAHEQNTFKIAKPGNSITKEPVQSNTKR